nr:T cell receptor beta [Gallus gallus]
MWTIWCMVLYFFGARAEINQPSILVLKEDENATLTCSQNDNHNYMSWRDWGGPNIQYFGEGTKVTVLGKNSEIIEPDVVIFSPSKQEIQEKKKATLVCLASGFFPDHLNLVWKVNGVKRTEGVGTDEISTSNGSTYSLTSRLRISAQEWFNPLNRFECIANFFKNGTQQSIQKIIYGDTGCDIFKENYQRSATAGKFVYIMLIFKSILYGIFVMGMMLWYKKMY